MKIHNKTWLRNYQPIEEVEAGIVLTGAEAKSLQQGRGKLEAAYVKISRGEAWLRNMEIFRYEYAAALEYDAFRPRKLLLNKKEILRWETKMASQPGLTIVPTACYSKGNKIKVNIALVKGRTDTQKRKVEKAKEIKRKQEKEIKEYLKK
jgi:SsrA-binding protein